MKKVKKGFLFILAALLLAACSGRLTEKTMTALLTDFYLYSDLPDERQRILNDSVSLPLSLFKKYGVTQEQFETSMRYYAAHPKEGKDLFEKVRTRLADQAASYKPATEAIDAEPVRSLLPEESHTEEDSLLNPGKIVYFWKEKSLKSVVE